MLLFEMLTGNAPFRAKNRAVLQKKILTEKIKYPTFLTAPAHKFLLALLQRDEARRCGCEHAGGTALTPVPRATQSKRLGNEASGGALAVQQHDFFKGINWRKLERREARVRRRVACAQTERHELRHLCCCLQITAPFKPAVESEMCA